MLSLLQLVEVTCCDFHKPNLPQDRHRLSRVVGAFGTNSTVIRRNHPVGSTSITILPIARLLRRQVVPRIFLRSVAD